VRINNQSDILHFTLTYRQANSGVVMTFWEVGKRINEEILGNERAEYGKRIVVTVSRQLETHYGGSFEEKNLRCISKGSKQIPTDRVSIVIVSNLKKHNVLIMTI
jgi:hypothetical protein